MPGIGYSIMLFSSFLDRPGIENPSQISYASPVKHELFVDTNIFLRFLTNDDPIKAKKAEALFKAAVNGKQRLRTSLLVMDQNNAVIPEYQDFGWP